MTPGQVASITALERLLVAKFGEPAERIDRDTKYSHRRLVWAALRGRADLFPQETSAVIVTPAIQHAAHAQLNAITVNGVRGVFATPSGRSTRIRVDHGFETAELGRILRGVWGPP